MLATQSLVDEIVFLDIEATKSGDVLELGVVFGDLSLKTSSVLDIENFIKDSKSNFICGHNFVKFDMQMLQQNKINQLLQNFNIIDTLPLSLLLFSEKTIHKLPKNYKNEDDFKNDPVQDSKLTKELLEKLEKRFLTLDEDIQNIFYTLLHKERLFAGFFKYLEQIKSFKKLDKTSLKKLIVSIYKIAIINSSELFTCFEKNPIELAYILALLYPDIEIKAYPPKILYDFPNILQIQKNLCFDYKTSEKNLSSFSKEVFGFGTFREFPKLNPTLFGKNSISQREIVEASLKDDSFLAILPTGGGKTFTFWLPAIIKANAYKSLTVVISPLQALIEDHIKSFNKNVANYKAVAISGFMSPLERAQAIEQTISGEADILYIAPESLRSNIIFSILKNRVIERFVIDEVHCLSTWGNDFRQDYYYICEYISELIKVKPFQKDIPISCFTATAKPSVIKDIKEYFFDGLGKKLDEYIAIPERKNLKYKSITLDSKNKYLQLLKLINEHNGSTLVYIPSSTKTCDEIAQKLSLDTDKVVKSFHSKLDSQIKMQILKEYITDEIDIIVATTAFGMGVDKANITNVIHYEVSDSLENYAQEAGRGARDTSLEAFCPILFDENDLDKHFASLNRSKLNASDINSVFKVLKQTKSDIVYKSTFELAKDAGWDVEDSSSDYQTKIKTALLELEREGYIERKRNKVHFYADSIASDSMQKLHSFLENSSLIETEIQKLTLVFQSILGRSKDRVVQVDELAYTLGYSKGEISETIYKLKEIGILGDSKDLSLQIKTSAITKYNSIKEIEKRLFLFLKNYHDDKVSIKRLNEELGREKNYAMVIKEIVKSWRDKSSFIFKRINRQNDIWYFEFLDIDSLQKSIENRHFVATRVIDIFLSKIDKKVKKFQKVEFSLKELVRDFEYKQSSKEIDRTLLYLHYLKVLELLNGRFINYSPMVIVKTKKFENKRKYTKEEYKKRLSKHYTTKVESIHIIGEYANRLNSNKNGAVEFMKDYFTIPYETFKRRYNLLKKNITRPITQKRYQKIFASLSDEQKKIIEDKESKSIMILAGPGSGKTKVLVHKIASLILTEDIKPEQFMMLTFSRSAVREFKNRLKSLIGELSYDIEINTFHSFCLNLIAREVQNENSEILQQAIQNATRQINSGDIELPLKTVLVLDEFQDINEDSFNLVKAIYEKNDKELKIIAVGDDDQCINTHAGARTDFIDKFQEYFGFDEDGIKSFKQYELLTNFRSCKNIVEYSNNFISKVSKRYKQNPLVSNNNKYGEVNIRTYNTNQLSSSVVKLIDSLTDKSNTAVLAYTNEEVLEVYSMLQEKNIPARYIIDREKFYLRNIVEVVHFDKILNLELNGNIVYKEEDFETAYEKIKSEYKNSKNLKLLRKIIDKFIAYHDKYYVSEWLGYLDEIKPEDFEDFKNTITVSTIHKSKGLEFDRVFLLVKETPKDDRDKRVYYVGMTRAKNSLTLLRYGRNIIKQNEYANYFYEDEVFEQRKVKVFIMGLDDIYLGFDYQKYHKDFKLTSGQKLTIKQDKYQKLSLFYHDIQVGVLSKKFAQQLDIFDKRYDCEVDFVVYWFSKTNEKYIQFPLCKITIYN